MRTIPTTSRFDLVHAGEVARLVQIRFRRYVVALHPFPWAQGGIGDPSMSCRHPSGSGMLDDRHPIDQASRRQDARAKLLVLSF